MLAKDLAKLTDGLWRIRQRLSEINENFVAMFLQAFTNLTFGSNFTNFSNIFGEFSENFPKTLLKCSQYN